jgi:taurine dioxygenase
MPSAIRPLSPALGAEVTGLDLAAGLDDATFARLKDAWLAHKVLVIRDQHFTTEQQIEFAGRFGPLEEVRTTQQDPNVKQYVMFVANKVVEGLKGVLPDGEMFFHSDQCYYERPCQLTMLFAIELPDAGGETLFADMGKVYRSLPAELKARIAGRSVLNMYDYQANPTTRNLTVNPAAPQYVHPIVTRHPETGEEILFVNRQMTMRIEGMDPAESEEILQQLFAAVENPDFIYEHRWRPGDLVMWDNRAVLHARRDFDPRQSRVLRRVTVKGTRPEAARAA